jgi:hypothetical protein
MQVLIDLFPSLSSRWLAYALLLLGGLCLWSGGRMGHLLPKPWSGAPRDWLPEHRRVLSRALAILCFGIVLVIGGFWLLWRQ